jgi:hypothetical protein
MQAPRGLTRSEMDVLADTVIALAERVERQ